MQHKIQTIFSALSQVVLGKEEHIKLALTCILARGHLLLEDLPGMGKTTLSQAIAKVMGLRYQRIQFTADILPGDILGGSIFNPQTTQFSLHKGPIFNDVILADEINRANPKSQSALLEAMEERQVTLDGQTYSLPEPFFVIATQNPSTSSGTFPLPESQLDRFLMRISLGYPAHDAEFSILKGNNPRHGIHHLPTLLNKEDLKKIHAEIDQIRVADPIIEYILRIAESTRTHNKFKLGLSPRGSIALLNAARAFAFIHHRDYVIPDDIKAVLPNVCGHRLIGVGTAYQNNTSLTDWLLSTINPI